MVESLLVTVDFSEIEKRIAAWDGWREGPIASNGFPLGVSPTGRLSYSRDPEPQYLARQPKAGVASDPIANLNEES